MRGGYQLRRIGRSALAVGTESEANFVEARARCRDGAFMLTVSEPAYRGRPSVGFQFIFNIPALPHPGQYLEKLLMIPWAYRTAFSQGPMRSEHAQLIMPRLAFALV